MNKELLLLFNNGLNDGTIEFITNNGSIVKCHDFVFRTQCDYGRIVMAYQTIISGASKQISLTDYSQKIVCAIISRMYSDEYIFDNKLEALEIIEIVKLADFLIVKNFDNCMEYLCKLFYNCLTDNNWLELLERINGEYIFRKLKKKFLEFYEIKIMDQNDMIIRTSDDKIYSMLNKIKDNNNKINSILEIKFRISKLQQKKHSNEADNLIDKEIDALIDELHELENNR